MAQDKAGTNECLLLDCHQVSLVLFQESKAEHRKESEYFILIYLTSVSTVLKYLQKWMCVYIPMNILSYVLIQSHKGIQKMFNELP